MSDIEIVVKIPEEMYKWMNDVNKCFDDYGTSDFIDLIKNGTQLPKGHGDLVDVNEVEEYLNNIQLELDGWGETDKAIEIAKARMGLDTVSTIIEAEKEKK